VFPQDVLVIGPLALGVCLVGWVLYQRVQEGLGFKELLLDRQFLTALFYTGALLSIYLSCIHYYNVASAYQAAPTTIP
jgi:hypothetical protein